MKRELSNPPLRLLDRLTPWRSPISRLGDALVLAGAMAGAVALYGKLNAEAAPLPSAWLAANITWLLVWFGLMLVGLHLASVYTSTRTSSWLGDLYGIVSGLSIASVLTLVAGYLGGEQPISRLLFVLIWALSVTSLTLWRWLARRVMASLRRHGVGQGRLLIVGGGPAAERLIGAINRAPALGYQVVGHIDDQPSTDSCAWLGALTEMEEVIERHAIDDVIIAGPSLPHAHIMDLAALCRRRMIPLKLLPDTYELALTQVALEQIDSYPLVSLTQEHWSLQDSLKRVMDVLIAGVALLLLAPIALAVAALVRLDSPGPVVFRQTRVGRHGRHFTFYKFRSMHVNAEAQLEALRHLNEVDGPIFKMRHDPRVTRVGRWLRRTSLDELPQLVNVLKGDMSLVGPRPAVPSEVAKYTPWQRARLAGMPGITGLWQVSGRSQLSFDEMVHLDLDYMQRRSLVLDLVILLRTVPAVLSKRGAF